MALNIFGRAGKKPESDNARILNNVRASPLYKFEKQLTEIGDYWLRIRRLNLEMESMLAVGNKGALVAAELERKKLEAGILSRLRYIGGRL